ncbi:N-acetyl-alpha-D-glucosaminyl L-malate synthase [Nymphaea thermarum]|nr:N-acetyl-alpha-D-glucosaminyl L-malate synthase [Nymphaea thermarum]
MEEAVDEGASWGNAVKLAPLRLNPSLTATSSGRLTPRHSPSYRRSPSSRTPRKDLKIRAAPLRWVRGKRLLPWLVMIAVWSYVGFHIQSKWAYQENKDFPGYKVKTFSEHGTDGHINNSFTGGRVDAEKNQKDSLKEGGLIVDPNKISINVSSNEKPATPRAKRRRSAKKKVKKAPTFQGNRSSNDIVSESRELNEGTQTSNTSITYTRNGTPVRNTSYGPIIGPFGTIEDSVLEWNPGKRSGTCDRKSLFAQSVQGRSVILIFHELSTTGAPISMMELASELLNCGGTVSVVALSKKGGLMGVLFRRGIKVLMDKADRSYRAASKADFVIAGSAVCASWIEQYLLHYKNSWSQLIWWIMENRRPYFERSKHVLPKVKMLMFLSESQSKQWLSWCKEENIELKHSPALVPLSVNDELAFAAGIPSSLNSPSLTVEKMLEKRKLLRDAIRRELGLSDNDMLVMTLSSINPGKGQFLLLHSAALLSSKLSRMDDKENNSTGGRKFSTHTGSNHHLHIGKRKILRAPFQSFEHNRSSDIFMRPTWAGKENHGQNLSLSHNLFRRRHLSHDRNYQNKQTLSLHVEKRTAALKVLIGSIGCKSNKVVYVKSIIRYLSQHPELAKAMLWTPTTTHVASLYAAGDAYVINAQGLGETFGRVTIEAMAFGLPILGTDAGGTREIVEHNITGLLHPLGQKGVQALADNLEFLLYNPSAREAMGAKGREKVQRLFLKNHMYQKIAEVLKKCMKNILVFFES